MRADGWPSNQLGTIDPVTNVDQCFPFSFDTDRLFVRFLRHLNDALSLLRIRKFLPLRVGNFERERSQAFRILE